jgi:hypothetical protein
MKKNIIAAIMGLFFTTGNAVAEYTVNGQVIIGMPKLDMQIQEALVAFVNEGNISFSKNPDSICDFTDNFANAGAQNNKLNCLVEFSDIPTGMVNQNLSLVGVPSIYGSHLVNASIYFRSGVENEKILIKSDQWAIDIENPKEPKVLKISTIWNVGEKLGTELLNHGRSEYIKNFYAEVEPRPYEQRFSVSGNGECIIPKLGTNCSINSQVTFPEELGLSGEIIKNINMSSANAYFNQDQPNITLKYDFTPPLMSDFGYRALYEKNLSQFTPTYVLDYSMENNTANLIIKSNYIGKTESNDVNPIDQWYLPDEDKTILKLIAVDKDGNILADIQPFYLSSTFKEVNSERAVYSFDLKKLADGYYMPEVNTRDKHNNISPTLKPNVMTLDRTPPIIYVKHNDNDFSGGSVYAFANLTFRATDGLNPDPKIASVMFSGESFELIPYEKDPKWVRIKEPGTRELSPNQLDKLRAYSYDVNGNEGEWVNDVNYLPIVFRLNTDAISAIYQKISMIDIPIDQTAFNKCSFYNEQDAITRATFGEVSCMTETITTPDGLATQVYNKNFRYTGVLNNLGLNDISADIFSYNKYGDKIFAGHVDTSLVAELPPEPGIIFLPTNNYVQSDYIPVSTLGEIIGKLYVTSYKEVLVNIDYKDTELSPVSLSINKSNLSSAKTTQMSLSIAHSSENKGHVWEKNTFSVTASYKDFPSVINNYDIKYLNIPPFAQMKIKLTGKDSDGVIFDRDTYNLKVELGVNTPNGIVYDADSQGEWYLYMAIRDSNGVLVPITEKIKAVDGGVNFALSGLAPGKVVFEPVAELISPYSDIQKLISGERIYTEVLNTGTLTGNISQSTRYGVAPMYTRTVLNITDQTYQKSLGGTIWQESFDGGNTWTDHIGDPIQAIFNKSLMTKQNYTLRVKLLNKYSDAIGYSNQVTYVAVDKPDFIINGPSNVFDGDTVVVKPELTDSTIELKVDYEYSEDKGKTYVPMTTDSLTFTGKKGDVKELYFRARYDESPSDYADGYSYIKYITAFVGYKAPSVKIGTDATRFEIGRTYNLTATVSEPYANMQKGTYFEFQLPDGTVTTDKKIAYTPKESDIDANGFIVINYKAYVIGFESSTTIRSKLMVKTINYVWPEFGATVNNSFPIIPSVQQIVVSPNGIAINYLEDLKYTWMLPEGISPYGTNSTENTYAPKFVISTPGKKTITGTMTDKRGNSTVLNVDVEGISAPPVLLDINTKVSVALVEPYSNYVVLSLTGGHKDDRVSSIKWYIDDVLIPSATSYQIAVTKLLAGEHKIRADVEMKLSIPVSKEITLNIAQNQPPTCDPIAVDVTKAPLNKLAISGKAVCSDPDSTITYQWFVGNNSLSKKDTLALAVKSMNEVAGLRMVATSSFNQVVEVIPTFNTIK